MTKTEQATLNSAADLLQRTHDITEQAALDAVNQLRAMHKLGKPLTQLPRGRTKMVGSCPVALALKHGNTASVGVSHPYITIYPYRDAGTARYQIETPKAIAHFLRLYDTGRYFKHLHPEYYNTYYDD